MPRTKAAKTVEEIPSTLEIVREIHQFIPSGVDNTTGRETPERLERHKEWNEQLQALADAKGKILVNCLEWHIVGGERVLSQCVQLPYHDARKWFDEGLGMYDVSGEVETILTGKRQSERTDAILEKLSEQSQLNTEILKALTALVGKVTGQEEGA